MKVAPGARHFEKPCNVIFFARVPCTSGALLSLFFFLVVNTSEREHAFSGRSLLADTLSFRTSQQVQRRRKENLSSQFRVTAHTS